MALDPWPTAKKPEPKPEKKRTMVTADPVGMGRRAGLANVAAHAEDDDYFRKVGRLGGIAKARKHSNEAKAIREAAARGEMG